MYKLILTALTLALAGCAPAPTQAELDLASAKASVSRELIDPTSPLFSELIQRPNVVCGYVNAKNVLGAYTGPKRFFWNSTGGAIIEPIKDNVTVLQAHVCSFEANYKSCQTGGNATDGILACARASYAPR